MTKETVTYWAVIHWKTALMQLFRSCRCYGITTGPHRQIESEEGNRIVHFREFIHLLRRWVVNGEPSNKADIWNNVDIEHSIRVVAQKDKVPIVSPPTGYGKELLFEVAANDGVIFKYYDIPLFFDAMLPQRHVGHRSADRAGRIISGPSRDNATNDSSMIALMPIHGFEMTEVNT